MKSSKKRLRAPFVVTISTLSLVACGRDAAKPTAATVDVPPTNPPMPTATATPTASPSASASASASASKDDRPDFVDYPRSLNATDASQRLIFRAYGDAARCFVELPWPKGQPRLPGQVKAQDVPCPPQMTSAAWAACPGGTINAKKDGAAECACFQTGNPPPLPRKVPCP